MKQPSVEALQKWFAEHRDQILSDYFTFLSFPSISTDPAHAREVRQTADWLSAYLNKMGLKAELWETPGHPIVFATHLEAGPDRPTLLIYHHYDVQPVDPLDLWDSQPFKPVVKNNEVFARGAADNKGQCFYSLCAIRATLELAKKLNINLKVFIEGEEESGGRGTAHIVPQKKEELQADHLLIVDLDIPAPGVAAITLGIRGILALELELKNSRMDLHSGSHGGIALNPNRALAKLIASLWDDEGKVTVPDFYKDVRKPTEEELASLDKHFDLESYQKNFGVNAFSGEKGYSLLESNWLRPTLEINGMSGGYTGEGFKTVIPSKAIAKISCRLVPDQDPKQIEKALIRCLESRTPKGMELKVVSHHGGKAFRSSPTSLIAKAAAQSFEEVFGKPCKCMLAGGSIPIVVDLAEISGAEVALMGVGLAEDAIHSPNEHFGLDRLEQGFLVMGRILGHLQES